MVVDIRLLGGIGCFKILSLMKEKQKLSILSIIVIGICLIVITTQFVYLQNIELGFYESLMKWLMGEQENYFAESYFCLTFFTLIIGTTTLSERKHHVIFSLILAFSISVLLVISPFIFDNPINYALRKSGIFLIVIIILLVPLNDLSYSKFERPCKYYSLSTMDEETSIYDVAYSILPIIALGISWII